MSRVTSLGEAFDGTKSYINLTVKIIKQVRATQFLVADATGFDFGIRSHSITILKALFLVEVIKAS